MFLFKINRQLKLVICIDWSFTCENNDLDIYDYIYVYSIFLDQNLNGELGI